MYFQTGCMSVGIVLLWMQLYEDVSIIALCMLCKPLINVYVHLPSLLCIPPNTLQTHTNTLNWLLPAGISKFQALMLTFFSPNVAVNVQLISSWSPMGWLCINTYLQLLFVSLSQTWVMTGHEPLHNRHLVVRLVLAQQWHQVIKVSWCCKPYITSLLNICVFVIYYLFVKHMCICYTLPLC